MALRTRVSWPGVSLRLNLDVADPLLRKALAYRIVQALMLQ